LLFAAHTPELSATPNILAERRTDGRPGSFDSLNTLLRNRAHVIERIDTEVEMLERHLRVLRVVIRNEPIGIVQLAEELSIPDHKARYSLRVLEEGGLIEPTGRGATTTDDLGGYVDRANGRIDGLRERVVGLATDGEGDETADVVGTHASEP
jgi:predicted transcriptional regulator